MTLKSESQTISKSLNKAKRNIKKRKVILYVGAVFPGAAEKKYIPIIEKIINFRRNIYFGFKLNL
tara:strand:+ start:428 stop:622 length:195 start_codon:yes stop_codon:yes gene_type:complete